MMPASPSDIDHEATMDALCQADAADITRRLCYSDIAQAVVASLQDMDDMSTHVLTPLIRELTENPQDPHYPVDVRSGLYGQVGARLATLLVTIIDDMVTAQMESS